MKNMIEENHKKGLERIRKEYLMKKRRTNIVDTAVTIAIIVATALIIYGLITYTDKAVEKCTDKGYERNYCIEKVG